MYVVLRVQCKRICGQQPLFLVYRGLVKWYDRGLQNLWWEFDSLIPNQENRSLNWLRYFRGIAQLVARLLWEQDVAGSNPVASTNSLRIP